MHYIYVIKFPNGCSYIGQAVRPKTRHKILKTCKIPHKTVIVKKCKTKGKANVEEAKLIREYVEKGKKLYNRTNGVGKTQLKWQIVSHLNS